MTDVTIWNGLSIYSSTKETNQFLEAETSLQHWLFSALRIANCAVENWIALGEGQESQSRIHVL